MQSQQNQQNQSWQPGEQLWAQCRARFTVVRWEDLRPGDVIYHLSLVGRDNFVQGPLIVSDPNGKLTRNLAGIEIHVPVAQPVRLDNPSV